MLHKSNKHISSKSNKPLTLAIFLNIRFYFDGSKYTADERYYEFWTSFTENFGTIILCVPVKESKNEKGNYDVNLKDGAIEIFHLPYYKSAFDLYLRSIILLFRLKKLIDKRIEYWDFIGAVVPNILGIFFIRYAQKQGVPYFSYIRGNNFKTVRYEYAGYKKWIGCSIASILDYYTRRLIKKGPSFVVGNALYEKYEKYNHNGNLNKIVVSLISKDVLNHEITSNNESGNRLRLLNVGRLTAEKGVDYLLDAAYELKNFYDLQFELIIVGSGIEEKTLRKKVIELGLEKETEFTGNISDPKELEIFYQTATILIIPSLTEGLPKVLLEALAYNLPIVSTAVGGIPEIIKHGQNGLLVPPGNSQILARVIASLCSDKKLRKVLSLNSRKTIERYTLETQRDKIISALETKYALSISYK